MHTHDIGREETVCPPVLVLAFNRPDTTRRVLESLRAARPGEVFFAVDGPRAQRDAERKRVMEVRRLADAIDWDCRIHTLFREENLGCKLAVSQAITWFFSEVESGIILEDDCIAHPSFFRFAAELLARYEGDERISMISGDNFQGRRPRSEYSYYFSRYTHIWGWATWRRAWRLYDHQMKRWPELREAGWLSKMLGNRAAVDYWRRIFDETYGEKNSSWAYRWTFSAWTHGALTILPNVNLVSNIGFGATATHTLIRYRSGAALPVRPMEFPLKHPPACVRDEDADAHTQLTVYTRSPWWRRFAGKVYRRLRGM